MTEQADEPLPRAARSGRPGHRCNGEAGGVRPQKLVPVRQHHAVFIGDEHDGATADDAGEGEPYATVTQDFVPTTPGPRHNSTIADGRR